MEVNEELIRRRANKLYLNNHNMAKVCFQESQEAVDDIPVIPLTGLDKVAG